MLQGIETVNNYVNINTNKSQDAARIVSNSNPESISAVSQEVAAQKIKKVERPGKPAEVLNEKKDTLLEFLTRKIGRGEILSRGENLYLMGKKSSLYEQSMNIQRLRDRIVQRLEHKKENESLEQIFKELIEELKSEYGVPSSAAEANESANTQAQNSEEFVRMANALQSNFADYMSVFETSATESASEADEKPEVDIHLLGSPVDSDAKTDFEKDVEAKQEAEYEAVLNARKKLNQKMFSKLNSSI